MISSIDYGKWVRHLGAGALFPLLMRMRALLIWVICVLMRDHFHLLSRIIVLFALLRLIGDMETEHLLLNMIFNFIYVIQMFQAHRTF